MNSTNKAYHIRNIKFSFDPDILKSKNSLFLTFINSQFIDTIIN